MQEEHMQKSQDGSSLKRLLQLIQRLWSFFFLLKLFKFNTVYSEITKSMVISGGGHDE